MEQITSRKNNYIKYLRALLSSAAERRGAGEYVCAGEKLLREALASGAAVTGVLWAGDPRLEVPGAAVRTAPREILEYASPLETSRGPLFTVKMPEPDGDEAFDRALVLDGLQNPGNVGTIIRTAAAFAFGTVILAPGCADKYNPKTVQSAMGALFKCRVLDMDAGRLREVLTRNALPLYGADVAPDCVDVRSLPRERLAVAIGSEGSGLGPEIGALLSGRFTIPIAENTESLNAAAAAAVIMWELTR